MIHEFMDKDDAQILLKFMHEMGSCTPFSYLHTSHGN